MEKPARRETPVIIYLSTECPDLVRPGCMEDMASCGLRLNTCASVGVLESCLDAWQLPPVQPVILIVDGRAPDSFKHTAAARVLYPGMGIIVLCGLSDTRQVLAHLHAGADVWCPDEASPSILAAQIFRLLWRLQRAHETAGNRLVAASQSASFEGPQVSLPVGRSPSAAHWVVADHGWTIWTPGGRSVVLTPTERAFMCALWQAPDTRATHAALLAAIQDIRGHVQEKTSPSRLGVIVSRLRRKFTRAGAVLPLQSVHDWGYTLTASFLDDTADEDDQEPA